MLAKLFAGSIISLFSVVLVTTATAQDNRNVILFTVDDLGWADNNLNYSQAFASQRSDTDSFFETPNLRAMAQEGTTFTQAYSSSPVCSPARASLMLGQTPGRHGITQWIGGPDEPGVNYVRNLPVASTTIAEAFQASGFATAQSGKWHLGDELSPLGHGFDQNFGGGPQGTPGSWYADNSGGFAWANNLPGGAGNPAGEYLTDRLTRDAVSFIDSTSGNNQPFFLNLSHYGVHTPIEAPDRLRDKYLQKINSGSYAKFNTNTLNDAERLTLATYAAMVESVDESLGAVRQALVRNGIDQNTTVAFISDHGGLATEPDRTPPPTLNGPLRNGKGTLYEGGIRVPVLFSGPGVNAGVVNDTPIIGQDLFPTLLQSAGVALPNQTIDGVDLTSVLAGGGSVDRGDNDIVVHYPHRSPQGGFPSGTIIQGKSKLIQSYDHGGIERYDLANDISETMDLERSDLFKTETMRVELHEYLARTNSPVPAGFEIDTRHAGRPIDVPNGDFELNPVGDNTSTGPSNAANRAISNWVWVDDIQLSFGGLSNPNENIDPAARDGGPDFPGTNGLDGINGAMDGGQIVYFGSFTDTEGNNVGNQLIGIEQTLDEKLIIDGEYTVRFAAGAREDQNVSVDGLVRLLAGDTIIGQFETPHERNGLFRDYQFIVDASTLDQSLAGEPLKLQLFRDTDGGKVSFDNVRLFTTAIPEPSSFGLLAVATVLGARRNRRKLAA